MSTIPQQTTRRNVRFDSRRQRRRGAESGRPRGQRDSGGSHGTLEDLVAAVMGSVLSTGSATCPVCRAPELAEAGCRRCGAHLS